MSLAKALRPDWLTVLSGFLLTVSFPPWDVWPVIFVCLVPWFWALERAPSKWAATREGLWLSVLMSIGGFSWVAYVLKQFGNLPWALGILGLLIFSLIGQPQFTGLAALLRWAHRQILALNGIRAALLGLILAFAYSGLDYAVFKLFVDTLGHSLYLARNLRQLADLTGPWGLTTLIYLINLSVFVAIVRYRRRGEPSAWPAIRGAGALVGLTCLLLGLTFVYGVVRRSQIRDWLAQPHPTVRFGVLQGNIGDIEKIAAETGVRAAAEKVLFTFFSLGDKALAMDPRPDALVWPETAYPSTFRTPETSVELARDKQVELYTRTRGVPVLFGGYDHFMGKDHNAFFFLSPKPMEGLPGEGDLQIYRKNVLLLFGEYIPGAETFPIIKRWFPQVGNFGRGPGPQVLRVPVPAKPELGELKVGPIICYEALFTDYILDSVRQGSQLTLNITNDSWFGPFGEPQLHLALTAFRSIESRVPQLRATNTGISALITADGEITQATGIGTEELLIADVPVPKPLGSPILTWGNHYWAVCWLLGVLPLVSLAVFRWRQGRAPSPASGQAPGAGRA